MKVDEKVPNGNGQVNEKTRQGKPSKELGFLLHAIYGLDHYPDYLGRWSLDEINRLESLLKTKLVTVQKQKYNLLRQLEYSLKLSQSNTTLKPIYSKQCFFSTLKQPAQEVFRKAMSNFDPDDFHDKVVLMLKPWQLHDWVQVEKIPGVFSFPLYTESLCTNIIKDALLRCQVLKEKASFDIDEPRIDLDKLGMSWFLDLCFHWIMKPMSRLLFDDELGEGELDWRHGYVTIYSSRKTTRLLPHSDDSEITLNICLSDGFEGGSIRFHGLRGSKQEGKYEGEIAPKLGTAILHKGRHIHEVSEVTNGARYSLIIWTRSWSSTRAHRCPCCLMNREMSINNPCICGPAWN